MDDFEKSALQRRVFEKLRKYSGKNMRRRFHLAALLGYRHFNWHRDNLTERDYRILKMLDGPHGESIYRALKEQQFKYNEDVG